MNWGESNPILYLLPLLEEVFFAPVLVDRLVDDLSVEPDLVDVLLLFDHFVCSVLFWIGESKLKTLMAHKPNRNATSINQPRLYEIRCDRSDTFGY